jgi:hypothetical protein
VHEAGYGYNCPEHLVGGPHEGLPYSATPDTPGYLGITPEQMAKLQRDKRKAMSRDWIPWVIFAILCIVPWIILIVIIEKVT